MASAKPLTGADQLLHTGACLYWGFAVREVGDPEDADRSATVLVYDGLDAGGTLLDPIQLAAGESAREWYEGGIVCRVGVYVEVTGDVEGSVRFA